MIENRPAIILLIHTLFLRSFILVIGMWGEEERFIKFTPAVYSKNIINSKVLILIKQMIVEHKKRYREDDLFIVKVLAKNFEHRFYYKCLEKIKENYDSLKKQGVTHIIYSEPNWLIIASLNQDYYPIPPFNKKSVFKDINIIFYDYNHIEDVRASIEEKYYVSGLRKALVIEELDQFDAEELRDAPGGVPLSPLEEVALLPGFTRMSLEGMILRVKDHADINKKLYKPH